MEKKFKVSGEERRELKKDLNFNKSYVKSYWREHQVDSDMHRFTGSNEGMTYTEASIIYENLKRSIKSMEKQLTEEVLEMTHVTQHPIKKSDLGFHGNLFGGKLLSWLDAAAASYVAECCDTPRMVTRSIDKCHFQKPAREGQLIKIFARVDNVGTTSIKIYMEARSHNVYNAKQHIILATNFTFVRIDEQGDAIPISDRVRTKFN
jgi:acyl-CoA thioesterase YciA